MDLESKTFQTIDDYKTLDIILEHLKNLKKDEPFYYVRYGDGDIIMMYPESKDTIVGRSNQFNVTENLQNELANAWNIVDKNYWVAGSLNL